MRKDMKRVLIDTPRSFLPHENWGLQGRPWKGVGYDDTGLCPPGKRHFTGEGKGVFTRADRFNPLLRYLEKQVGRPWDEVWSEICAVNDARTVDGHHLRLHVQEWLSNGSLDREDDAVARRQASRARKQANAVERARAKAERQRRQREGGRKGR
jgi:hypothetical protein